MDVDTDHPKIITIDPLSGQGYYIVSDYGRINACMVDIVCFATLMLVL